MALDLVRLKQFVAVAHERSVRRGAEALGMTQPPVSRAIIPLEREFGCQFFMRNSDGVELTDLGWTLFTEAIGILEHVETAERAIRQAVAKRGIKSKSHRKSPARGKRRA